MRSNNRALAVLSAAVVSLSLAASAAVAADGVVIGSVNPVTGQTTLLTDKLKKQFTDGGAIAHLYLLARPEGAGYALVRAGRDAEGDCHTELIATETSGSDVLLRTPLQPLFTCEEVDDNCRPKPGLVVFCIPADTLTGCGCKPGFAVAPSSGPRCERVDDPLWNPEIADIVNVVP
jgi:hypothetical protein